MASLDNFHTGNGGAWRHHHHPTEQQYMNAIGLGLHSPDRWDMTNRVPIPSPLLDPGRHKRQLPRPSTVENRDSRVNDLYVPLASRSVHALKGDNVDSTLVYDRGVRHNQCPYRRWLNKGPHCAVRHRPY